VGPAGRMSQSVFGDPRESLKARAVRALVRARWF
jgi:hypothetical protein